MELVRITNITFSSVSIEDLGITLQSQESCIVSSSLVNDSSNIRDVSEFISIENLPNNSINISKITPPNEVKIQPVSMTGDQIEIERLRGIIKDLTDTVKELNHKILQANPRNALVSLPVEEKSSMKKRSKASARG